MALTSLVGQASRLTSHRAWYIVRRDAWPTNYNCGDLRSPEASIPSSKGGADAGTSCNKVAVPVPGGAAQKLARTTLFPTAMLTITAE